MGKTDDTVYSALPVFPWIRGLQRSSLCKEPTDIQNYLGATTSGPFRSSRSFRFSVNKLTGELYQTNSLHKCPNLYLSSHVVTGYSDRNNPGGPRNSLIRRHWVSFLSYWTNFLDMICHSQSILVLSLCK